MSARRIIRRIVLAVFPAVLALCVHSSTTVAAGHGITVTLPASDFPGHLNPYNNNAAGTPGDAVGAMEIDPLLFRGLTTTAIIGGRFRYVPDLLTRVPTASNGDITDGGRTVYLHIRPHQYWSSGAEITARDVVFGWKVGKGSYSGVRRLCLPRCGVITGASVDSRYAAVLHVKPSLAALDETQSLMPLLPPVIPHNWPRLGKDPSTALRMLCCDTSFSYSDPSYWTDGPFRLTEYALGTRITLERVASYRGPAPHLYLSDEPGISTSVVHIVSLKGINSITFSFTGSG